MAKEAKNKTWKGKTDGTPWMQRTLILLIRISPLWLIYGLMSLTIPFYLVFADGFSASYHFFRDRIGYGPVKSFFMTFVNEYNLGKVVIDRFATYGGKTFKIEVEGQEIYDSLCERETGFVMLSSHVGNYELAGYFLKASKRINALVYSGEAATVMEGRSNRFSRTNIRMIPIKEDFSHIFTLNEALSDGEIVSIAGDRIFGADRTVRSGFMGEKASFPLGPFLIAVQRDIPMATVFVMKESVRKYKAYVFQLPDTDGLARNEKTQALCDAYAQFLERIVRRYPFQWYNFYDFWA